jgi:lipid A 3-O-deacylase
VQLVNAPTVQLGTGNYVDVAGIELGFADWKRWAISQRWSLSVYGITGLAYWRGNSDTPNNNLVDLSAAPVARFEHGGGGSLLPYIEASIGVHLLSRSELNETRDFQHGISVRRISRSGVSFGGRHQFGIGLRVQHVSNGGIKNPNDGLTYGALVIRYRLRQR